MSKLDEDGYPSWSHRPFKRESLDGKELFIKELKRLFPDISPFGIDRACKALRLYQGG